MSLSVSVFEKLPNNQHSKAIYGRWVCRIVKLWTNPFGVHSYQDVALRRHAQSKTVGLSDFTRRSDELCKEATDLRRFLKWSSFCFSLFSFILSSMHHGSCERQTKVYRMIDLHCHYGYVQHASCQCNNFFFNTYFNIKDSVPFTAQITNVLFLTQRVCYILTRNNYNGLCRHQ